MKLLRYTLILGIISLSLYVLYVFKSLFVPMLIAIVIFYLIITLAGEYQAIKIRDYSIPRWFSIFLSIVTMVLIIWFLTILINSNIDLLVDVAPDYEEKLKAVITKLYKEYHIGKFMSYENFIDSINVKAILSSVIAMIKNIASNTGIIIVYVILLLLEYRTFYRKLEALLPNKKDFRRFTGILADINKEIKIYLRIKSLASLATSLISYTILKSFGVNFAAFWALLIFVLNFIPTIGSIVAVFFPVLITLIQFDSFFPFFAVTIMLTATQLTIGNILEPRFTGKRLNLSTIVIVVSLMFWGKIWGITGMFLCVPITVIINIILAKIPSTRQIAIILSANGKIISSKDK